MLYITMAENRKTSIGGMAFTLSREGWSDARKDKFYGTPFTDAMAGWNKIDPNGLISVGPGLTHYKSPRIKEGALLSAEEIISIWMTTVKDHEDTIYKKNKKIADLG